MANSDETRELVKRLVRERLAEKVGVRNIIYHGEEVNVSREGDRPMRFNLPRLKKSYIVMSGRVYELEFVEDEAPAMKVSVQEPAIAGTIDAHIRVLNIKRAVKWIALYDDETLVAEVNKPINSKAPMDSNLIFKGIFGDEQVQRINVQVKDGYETLLYIHSLGVFHTPYVGKVKHVEIIERINQADPLILPYYFKVIKDKKLRPHYSVTLTGIKEARSLELRDIVPSKKFRSGKFPYPYPMLVSQRLPVTFFDHDTPQIGELEIVYGPVPGLERKSWYVKKTGVGGSLTLGKKQVDLLRCFESNTSGITLASIVKKIYQSRRIKKEAPNKNASSAGAQYVHDLVSKVNKKFQNHFERVLIKNIVTAGNKKKYFLQVSKITFTNGTSGPQFPIKTE